MELMRPFPTEGTLYSEGRVVDLADKKSGALVVVNGMCLCCVKLRPDSTCCVHCSLDQIVHAVYTVA